MKTVVLTAALATLTGAALTSFPAAAAPNGSGHPLIPRSVLYGNPDKANPQLSPDGKRLAYLSPKDGVLNVWVAPAGDPSAAKCVTNDTSRGIRIYMWAHTNDHLLYLQDVGGDEDWQLFSVDLTSGQSRRLTPDEVIHGPDGEPLQDPRTGKNLKPTAQIQEISHKFPHEILIGLNNRDPQFHDLYRLNIKTGEKTLLLQNPGQLQGGMVSGFVTDDNYNLRLVSTFRQDGGSDLLKKTDGGWEVFAAISPDDALTTSAVGFDKTGKTMYMVDSRDRNTAALVSVDFATGRKAVIADDMRADISGAMVHPTEYTIQAVNFEYLRDEWKVLDKSIQPDFAYLRTVADGDFNVSSRTLDDKHWLVTYVMDDGPVRYYAYDRDARKARFLFTNRKDLEGVQLSKMHPTVIESRDGLNLVSYLTLPPWADSDNDGRPAEPLPMVLLVHGGPWARDNWGLNSTHQLLANRGYAVLSVNFRGSTGFGKEFLNAGNMEWAGKMHDDLVDAVKWAVDENIADEGRVAIMGGSYGGYATLVGLTFTPDTFACGVDIVGPSNIITLFESIPPYWVSFANVFRQRVGDNTTPEGQALLRERSPLTYVDRIKKPLLIGQGANDPRVKQAESDQIVQAMKAKKIPVTYVLFPDEGHGFARPENRMGFYAVTEGFLAQHLGGRYQPIDNDFEGSSITVPEGAALVPGVADATPN